MIELYGYLIKKIADVFLGEKIKEFIDKSKRFGKKLLESYNMLKELNDSLNSLYSALQAKIDLINEHAIGKNADNRKVDVNTFPNRKLLLQLNVTRCQSLERDQAGKQLPPVFKKTTGQWGDDGLGNEVKYDELISEAIYITTRDSQLIVRQAAYSLIESMDLISNELLEIYGRGLKSELDMLYKAEEGLFFGPLYKTEISLNTEKNELQIQLKSVCGEIQDVIRKLFPDFTLTPDMILQENENMILDLNNIEHLNKALTSINALKTRVDLSIDSLSDFIRNNWNIKELI